MKLEEAKKVRELAEKAQDQAEQDGYDLGVEKTKEALKVEVLRVCRTYCSQVWNETLNKVGVEASSMLRRAESMYYPPTIQKSVPSGSRTNTTYEVAEVGKDSLVSVPTASNKPAEEAEHLGVTEKEKNANRGVAPDALNLLKRWRLSWPFFLCLSRLIQQARALRP